MNGCPVRIHTDAADNVTKTQSTGCTEQTITGRFVELHAQDLGKYFLEKHLGRGVAKLDWNRDGAEDFAVSHLDRPAILSAV